MRYLLIACLLAFPATAVATPCGTQGSNVPLTANTRSTTQTTGAQAQGSAPAQGTQGMSSHGSLKATKQAYPH